MLGIKKWQPLNVIVATVKFQRQHQSTHERTKYVIDTQGVETNLTLENQQIIEGSLSTD